MAVGLKPESGIEVVILAAGLSTRMGEPKPLARIGGRFFLEHILGACRQAGFPVTLVLGHEANLIREQIDLSGCRVLVNESPERGPLSSLQIALPELENAAACLMFPVDHPLVSSKTLKQLAQADPVHADSIAIPCCEGKKGHPVLFPRSFFGALMSAPLEEGARWVVRQNPARIRLVETHDPGVVANLNTPEAVLQWERSGNEETPGAARSPRP